MGGEPSGCDVGAVEFNLISNGMMEDDKDRDDVPDGWTGVNLVGPDDLYCLPRAVFPGHCAFGLFGDPSQVKQLAQSFDRAGSSGDLYFLTIHTSGSSVTGTPQMRVQFDDLQTGGIEEEFVTPLATGTYVYEGHNVDIATTGSYTYDRITVTIEAGTGGGLFIDHVSLVREDVGDGSTKGGGLTKRRRADDRCRLQADRNLAHRPIALDHRREHLVHRLPHQASERISTSQAPAKPSASTAARSFGISITPSPIMPRSSSRSRVGTSQSQMWKAWMRVAAGAGDLREDVRVPPDVIDVDRDAEPARAVADRAGRRCRAPGASVFTQARSAAYIGCSGSMASGTPAASAWSSSAAIASSTCARAPAMSFDGAEPGRENCGRPPTTSTRHGAPSAAASSTARRLSSRSSARCAAIGRETCRRGNSRRGGSRRRARPCTARSRPTACDLVAPGREAGDAVPLRRFEDLRGNRPACGRWRCSAKGA